MERDGKRVVMLWDRDREREAEEDRLKGEVPGEGGAGRRRRAREGQRVSKEGGRGKMQPFGCFLFFIVFDLPKPPCMGDRVVQPCSSHWKSEGTKGWCIRLGAEDPQQMRKTGSCLCGCTGECRRQALSNYSRIYARMCMYVTLHMGV